MTLRTHARRAAALVTAAVSVGLVAAVLPSSSAAAADDDRMMLLDRTGGARQVSAWSSSAPDSLVRLTSRDTFSYGFNVSNDGNTWVAALRTGGADRSVTDASFALVLVHRGSSGTKSRVIASYFDANVGPAIGRGGRAVWWLAPGGALYKYTASSDWSTGTTTFVSASGFAPAAGERAVALAVSPNGLNAAVVYKTATTSRVVAKSFAYSAATAATQPFFTESLPVDGATTTLHGIDPLVWRDNDTLLYARFTPADPGVTPPVTAAWAAEVRSGGASTASALTDAAGRYGMRYTTDASNVATWWTWRDTYTGTTLDGSTYGKVADPTTAPVAELPFNLGDTTSNYAPATSVPPVMPFATNRATSNARLFLSGPKVLWDQQLAYLSFTSYLQPLPGQSSDAAYASFRGELQWTYNPFVANPVWNKASTSGATRFSFGSANPGVQFNGKTPKLRRNAWFRWYYPGDELTRPDWTDGTVKATVRPEITIVKDPSGSLTRVRGQITRSGGTAVLRRLLSGSWTTIATTTINSEGGYSFGYRRLPVGTYKVTSLETQFWGFNEKQFTI